MYKIAIIEDEKHQQDSLVDLLNEYSVEFEIVGVASTITQARDLLKASKPDLAFMDVMLPPDTSFDLIASLPSIPFEIVFITSYEEYAIKAFRLSAIDYLLKPIMSQELEAAIQKFKQKRSTIESDLRIKILLDNLRASKGGASKIALPTLTGFKLLKVSDVVRCESDNTYTTFHTVDKKKIVVSRTLKDCEQMLEGFRFYRVHNCHLVNLDFVTEYVKGEGGVVKTADGSEIDVSRRRKDGFLRLFK